MLSAVSFARIFNRKGVRKWLSVGVWLWYNGFWQLAPERGCLLMNDFFTVIVGPCVVGIVTALFADWLDQRHRHK